MSIPKFPTLFISPIDRGRLSLDKTPTITVTEFGDIILDRDFIDNFLLVSAFVSKNVVKQITMTIQKINGHGLLNTVFEIGTVTEGFRPANDVTGNFKYGVFQTDVGQIALNSSGALSIRTGNNTYFADGTTETLTLLYL